MVLLHSAGIWLLPRPGDTKSSLTAPLGCLQGGSCPLPDGASPRVIFHVHMLAQCAFLESALACRADPFYWRAGHGTLVGYRKAGEGWYGARRSSMPL